MSKQPWELTVDQDCILYIPSSEINSKLSSYKLQTIYLGNWYVKCKVYGSHISLLSNATPVTKRQMTLFAYLCATGQNDFNDVFSVWQIDHAQLSTIHSLENFREIDKVFFSVYYWNLVNMIPIRLIRFVLILPICALGYKSSKFFSTYVCFFSVFFFFLLLPDFFKICFPLFFFFSKLFSIFFFQINSLNHPIF